MNNSGFAKVGTLAALVLALGAVIVALRAVGSGEGSSEATATAMAAADVEHVAANAPEIHVFKTATCGCCSLWLEHMRAAGFSVVAEDVLDIVAVKRMTGVDPDLHSCHTALVDGYVVEGHVPADVVAKLLADRPDIAGIAVPGMPIGSPGMEGPNPQAYDVIAFSENGGRSVFAHVPAQR